MCFSFPFASLPANGFTLSSLSLYRSFTHGLYPPGEHDALFFFLKKELSNGWIRIQQRDKGCRESKRKEEWIKAYSSGLLSHYSGTGLSRPTDWPPKERPHPLIRPPLFSKPSRISVWAQRRAILCSFWAVRTRFVYPCSAKARIRKYNTGRATDTAVLLVGSYEMMLADNGG